MNSEIKIIDNFLLRKDLEKITNPTLLNWWMQISNSDSGDGLEFLSSNKTDDQFFNTYLFDKVIEKLNVGFYELERVYYNGQWNGRETDYHRDGCDLTALIYLSPYEYGWGGFTEIMTEPEPTLVHPIPNRLMIFPGNIPHKAYSFAYQRCPLRVTLAFKINKK